MQIFKLKLFFLILFSFFAVMCCLNYQLDPAGLRSSNEVYSLALRQKANQVLISDTEFDQRAWIKAQIGKHKTCPQILQISSTTMMTMGQKHFRNHSFINLWLTGPSINDLEAISLFLEEEQCKPELLIVSVDSWFFYRSNANYRWGFLIDEYSRYHNLGGLETGLSNARMQWHRFVEMLGAGQGLRSIFIAAQRYREFQENGLFNQLLQLDDNYGEGFCKLHSDAFFYARRADGQFEFCPRVATHVRAGENALKNFNQKNFLIRSDREFDPTTINRFHALGKRLAALRIKVLTISPAVHPGALAVLNRDPNWREKFERANGYLRDFALLNGGAYIDYTSTQNGQCSDNDYFDFWHAYAGCYAFLAQKIESEFLAPSTKNFIARPAERD